MMIAYWWAAAVVAIVAAFAGYHLWSQWNQQKRGKARRARNFAHQRAWNTIMRRPRTPQITDQRETD